MTSERMMTYGGWALSVLAILFLLMDAGMKLAGAQVALEASAQLGFDADQVWVLGVILLVATIFYAFPPTAALGAILITGYLGGAIAVNLQHHRPLVSHMLFGVYIALFVWGGLFLRWPSIRALLPLARG
ncbi:DoxX family protein [Bradyrhizobium sp. SYSU BS000235]|uniref:DoxX family protein n=1 Tax=Bradyrhizobium sp. SYSU BS000235 TaxID=3411332 RepID=UPI003C743649